MEEVEAACSTWAKEVAEIVNRVVNKRRVVVEIRRSERLLLTKRLPTYM